MSIKCCLIYLILLLHMEKEKLRFESQFVPQPFLAPVQTRYVHQAPCDVNYWDPYWQDYWDGPYPYQDIPNKPPRWFECRLAYTVNRGPRPESGGGVRNKIRARLTWMEQDWFRITKNETDRVTEQFQNLTRNMSEKSMSIGPQTADRQRHLL